MVTIWRQCADSYFRDSEQISNPACAWRWRVRLHRTANGLVTQWRAGGLMLQYLPPSSLPDRSGNPWRMEAGDWVRHPTPEDGSAEADAWTRAQALYRRRWR